MEMVKSITKVINKNSLLILVRFKVFEMRCLSDFQTNGSQNTKLFFLLSSEFVEMMKSGDDK